jgi:hypothetical protein
MKRNEKGLPEEGHADGLPIMRNPGVALVYVALKYEPFSDGAGGFLFRLGNPVETYWYAEGRTATRAEVMASIDSGLPILRESAEGEGLHAVAELNRMTAAGMELVPLS